MPIPDYYRTLEIGRHATVEEIKQAFRRQAKQYHPDKNPGQEKSAERMFRLICIAYEILRDSQRKLKYDLTLKATDRERELRSLSIALSLDSAVLRGINAIRSSSESSGNCAKSSPATPSIARFRSLSGTAKAIIIR